MNKYNYGYEYAEEPKSLESKAKEIVTKPYNKQSGRDSVNTMFFAKKRYRK